MVALAALYVAGAQVGYALGFAGPIAAVLWLPVGVGIAFLYLGGLQLWPAVLVGDLLVNDYSALPLGSALGQTCGNVLEVTVAAFLIRRLVPNGSPLEGLADLTRTLAAIAVGTALSATIGALSLALGHAISIDAVPRVWRTWWLGDASGALVVVPLAIAWYRPWDRESRDGRHVEAALLLATVAGLSELAVHSDRPLTYLVFPGLIWAAVRFGQRGATLAIAIATGFGLWATIHFVGPLTSHSFTHTVLNMQLYIAVAALSTLCLAALVSERQDLANRLGASRARVVEATDIERRRLERDLHDGAQQRLSALAVRLGIASERAREDPDLATAVIADAERELVLAIDEVRELAHGLHPTVLTRMGLAKFIEGVAARSAVPIELLELPSLRVDPGAETAAYYVVAEAITNAQKHAHASTIWVRAAVARGILRVEIVDDGDGGAAASAGFGLQGLRDRVEAIGGTFEVSSRPDHGTRVTADIPAKAAPL